MFIKKIRKTMKNKIHFDKVSFDFRIIFNILQKINHFVQKKWFFVISLTTTKRESKNMTSKMKFEKNKKWHINENILYYEKKLYIFSNKFKIKLMRLHHDDL